MTFSPRHVMMPPHLWRLEYPAGIIHKPVEAGLCRRQAWTGKVPEPGLHVVKRQEKVRLPPNASLAIVSSKELVSFASSEGMVKVYRAVFEAASGRGHLRRALG